MMLGREHLIAAAQKLWGLPTEQKEHEWRFGSHGSKSINLSDLVWYDYENEVGGGVVDLCARAKITDPGNGHDAQGSAWITYDYRDERGTLLFQVVRKPGHKFLQRHPNPRPVPNEDPWIWNLTGVRRVPYRLPQLIAASRDRVVFVCEGEKDADNLAALGCITTTNPGGAGKWRQDFSIFLADRDVIILPDNDEAGRSHAADVTRSLRGIARSIRVLELPDLHDKEDVSDWIARGGTAEMLRDLARGAPQPPETNTDWIVRCATSKNGDPIPNLQNTLIALHHDASLKSILTFNQMLRTPMIARSAAVPLEDDDITDIQEYLQIAGIRRLSRDTVRQGVVAYAGDHPYHPVRDYLEGLSWDGTHRSLTTYLGITDRSNYGATVCDLFLISMVARIFRPGCKVDYMLVLEGPQGVLKSMACRVLFGDDYFSDNLPDISTGKDVSVHLRGKWGIEIAELHAFSKAESTLLKQFVSRQHERYRPPYGHMEVDEPRQCVFIGTTNKDTYLKDETGGRRFWPLITGEIRIDDLIRDRDQLLAQAVDEFQRGLPWWPDRDFEQKVIVGEQKKRFDQDAWYGPIKVYIDTAQADSFSVAQIAHAALGISAGHLDRSQQMRIAAVLRELNCQQKHTDKGNVWVPPPR